MKGHVISEWPFQSLDSGDCLMVLLILVSSFQAEPQCKVVCGARIGQAVRKTGCVDLAPVPQQP